MMIIQFITVHWTKKSRGAPEASLRNLVPEAFPLPHSLAEYGKNMLQEIDVYETNQFEHPNVTVNFDVTFANLRNLNLEFMSSSDGLGVFFWGDTKRPSYPKAKKVFTLSKGTYGRIISNGRFSSESMWHYQKHIYNIYFGETTLNGQYFEENNPASLYKDETNLY